MEAVQVRVAAEDLADPKRIKVSSKRQITIPASSYEKYGFAEYAYLEETEEGLLISPIDQASDDEELTERLLLFLIEEGYEGQELLEKYKEIKPKFISIHSVLKRSEQDIEAGRVRPAAVVQSQIRQEHGL